MQPRTPGPDPRSRTVRGNRQPFNFFVLAGMIFPVVLFGTIELFLPLAAFLALRRAFTAKMCDKILANRIQRQNVICLTLQNPRPRPSRTHADAFSLPDGI